MNEPQINHSPDCDIFDRSLPDGMRMCNCRVSHSVLRTFQRSKIIALIAYDPDLPDGQQVQVAVTDLAVGFLSTLTDFELKVFAAEVGLIVRKSFEMPPSPTPNKP